MRRTTYPESTHIADTTQPPATNFPANNGLSNRMMTPFEVGEHLGPRLRIRRRRAEPVCDAASLVPDTVKQAPWLAAGASYIALTIVLTWPLVAHLASTVPHDLGDPLLSASLLWWNAHVLPLTSRWWNGLAFYPAHGTMAFSDHRIGESLIASPLQWLGCSPLAAYNLTFLATFPLCALAAHALAYTLTRRHDTGLLAGLAFGFSPYRLAHLEHLELLAAFGMAWALAALHVYRRTEDLRWLVAFAVALFIQGLCATYYLLFFSVLLLMWIAWFVSWRDGRVVFSIGAAIAVVATLLSPIAIGYLRVHRAYGFSRTAREVELFSADLTSFVTASPLSALWGWTSGATGLEHQLFLGLTITLAAVAGAVVAARRQPMPVDRVDMMAIALWCVSAVFLAIAILTARFGPWRVALGRLSISAAVIHKPISAALATLSAGLLLSSPVRGAWRRRSPLAFYAVTTAALLLCSLGPKPTYQGMLILYEPPYAWLMRLPFFGSSVRVPARFAMLAALTLGTAGALGFDRFGLRGPARRALVALFALGIVADGWATRIPLPTAPELWPVDRASMSSAVIELPVGDYVDAAAMYRATRHGRPLLNGTSGFFPPHWRILARAVDEGDLSVLNAFFRAEHLLVVVDNGADSGHRWHNFLERSSQARWLVDQSRWSLFDFSPRQPPQSCAGPALPIAAIFDQTGPIKAGPLLDRDARTGWSTRRSQRVGDFLTIDLGAATRPCAFLMNVGEGIAYVFPRRLSVATSLDGSAWTTVFDGSTSAQALRAAIKQPTDAWLEFRLPQILTRFIRLRLETLDPTWPWVVTDVEVRRSG